MAIWILNLRFLFCVFIFSQQQICLFVHLLKSLLNVYSEVVSSIASGNCQARKIKKKIAAKSLRVMLEAKPTLAIVRSALTFIYHPFRLVPCPLHIHRLLGQCVGYFLVRAAPQKAYQEKQRADSKRTQNQVIPVRTEPSPCSSHEKASGARAGSCLQKRWRAAFALPVAAFVCILLGAKVQFAFALGAQLRTNRMTFDRV